eukprot:scaffold1929_cov376-Prasinococcus_capsulatus_cf.AAC.22
MLVRMRWQDEVGRLGKLIAANETRTAQEAVQPGGPGHPEAEPQGQAAQGAVSRAWHARRSRPGRGTGTCNSLPACPQHRAQARHVAGPPTVPDSVWTNRGPPQHAVGCCRGGGLASHLWRRRVSQRHAPRASLPRAALLAGRGRARRGPVRAEELRPRRDGMRTAREGGGGERRLAC